MSTEKIIEILESLADYAAENWDMEYQQDIDAATEAVRLAVQIIRGANVCGTLQLDGKNYLICGEPEEGKEETNE